MCGGEMMCGARSTALIALLCMWIISVSSGAVYVRSGSDMSGCDMKCPMKEATLELNRKCGGEEKTLLQNHCYYNDTISHDPRVTLDAHSGCWKLTPARKDDSCVYKVHLYDIPERLLSSTEIRVLDPVLISNISGTVSRLGEEMSVSVQFSGEESAVTWEVDGEPLPERYRLIDDNRTLIIPSVQRDDAERTIRVRITNRVSEETKDYKLSHDPIFSKLQEAEDSDPVRPRWDLTLLIVPIGVVIGVSVILIAGALFVRYKICSKRRETAEIESVNTESGNTLLNKKNGFVAV